MERGHTSLRKTNMYWNILLTSFSNHLNGKTNTRKVGPQNVLTLKKDGTIMIEVLNI
jgi:hypothetical protein